MIRQTLDEEIFVAALLEQILEDRNAGRPSRVVDYEARFPGRESLVRQIFADLEGSADNDPAEVEPPLPASSFGPYRLIRRLGVGGQGEVFLAEHEEGEPVLALKLLHPWIATSEAMRARFRREAEIATRLAHPGLCPVFDSGVIDGTPFIAMKFLEGQALGRRATGIPRTADSVAERLAWLADTAAAIQAAHDAGVLHRDIKPSNILIPEDGQPVVLDFGLARLIEEDPELRTRTGDLFGSPAYLPPEALRANPAPADRARDIYALGVTAYEVLTGQRPFEAPTRESLWAVIQKGALQRPSRLARALPRSLDLVLSTALARNPALRYSTALAFEQDLRRVRSGQTPAAKPPALVHRIGRWLFHHPALTTIMLLCLVLVGLSGVLLRNAEDLRAQAELRVRSAVEAQIARGFLHLGQKSTEALEALDAALEQSPEDEEALAGRIIALLIAGDSELAEAELERSAYRALSPDLHRLLKVEVLEALGQRDAAEALFTDQPFPREPVIDLILSRRLLGRGERGDPSAYAEACERLLHTALSTKEPRALTLYFLAEAAGRARRADLARAASHAITKRWPESATGLGFAANALTHTDPKAAIPLALSALALRPNDPRLATILGRAYQADDQLGRARAAYESALAQNPDSFDASVQLAEVLASEGDVPGGIAIYERLAGQTPDHPTLHYSLGNLHLRMRTFEAARQSYETAIRLLPEHAGFHCNLGIALQELGRLDAARAAMEKSLALEPEHPERTLNLASIEADRGELIVARHLLSTPAGQRSPPQLRARLQGRIAMRLGQPIDAVSALRRAESKDPSLPLLCDLGLALRAAGDYPLAITALQRARQFAAQSNTQLRSAIDAEIAECQQDRLAQDALRAVQPDRIPHSLRGPDSRGAIVAERAGHFSLAAHLWQMALSAAPNEDGDASQEHLMSAARAALLAAEGVGADSERSTAAERRELRLKGLEWLQIALNAAASQNTEDPSQRIALRILRDRMAADPAFSAIMDPLRRSHWPPQAQLAAVNVATALQAVVQKASE